MSPLLSREAGEAMANKVELLQRMRRWYSDETGKKELDHREVAEFMLRKGWKPPTPRTAVDILAKELSSAARAEERVDKKTGQPYRANMSYAVTQGAETFTLWVDTDEATRFQMDKALKKHRDQMVGEAYRMVLTADHWNRVNPNDVPLQIPLDLQPDVDWLKNAPGEDEKAS
jgi:hypothetical protein